MEKVRLGVVGLGNMGRTISKCQIAGMEFAAVCSSNENAGDIAGELFGRDCIISSDYNELINSGSIDAVYIATPHYTHPALAIAAFEAGLHVMLEKPAGAYVEQVEELNKVAAEYPDKVFGIMFNQRFRPEHMKLKEILDSEESGRIIRSNWIITDWFRSEAYYKSSSWRATWEGEGGGVLINQCPHNLDLWQWFCGMPERILAKCRLGAHHNIEVEDEVSILAEFADGTLGSFIASTGEAPGSNRLEIITTRGKLLLENGRLVWFKNLDDIVGFSQTSADGFLKPEYEKIEFEFDDFRDEHEAALADFIRAVQEGKRLIVAGEEGLKSLSIANAAYLSEWRNNCWVELPLKSGEYYSELEKHF